jgi:hypothetical protein
MGHTFHLESRNPFSKQTSLRTSNVTHHLAALLLQGVFTTTNTIPAMPTVPQSYLHYKQSHKQTQNNVNLYVKDAAPVISPHCTNTRHSYVFQF